MSTISLYPKTWAKYQQEMLNLADQHGMLLLNSDYTFDESHRDLGDVSSDAIIAEATLNTIQYDGGNNRFTVADGTFRQVIPDEDVVSVILYRMDEYLDDARLVFHSDDITTGLPITTTGVDITISFPDGILVLAPSGYTTPTITLAEEEGMGGMEEQINNDIENILMNIDEFGTTIQYTHTNYNIAQYVVLKTATPENVQLVNVDMNTIAQTIKMQNSKLKSPPRRGDKVLMEGVTYNVAGALAENYTTDVFLQITVA